MNQNILRNTLLPSSFGGGRGFGFYGPFKNISHIEPIIHQRWAKTGEPEKSPEHP